LIASLAEVGRPLQHQSEYVRDRGLLAKVFARNNFAYQLFIFVFYIKKSTYIELDIILFLTIMTKKITTTS